MKRVHNRAKIKSNLTHNPFAAHSAANDAVLDGVQGAARGRRADTIGTVYVQRRLVRKSGRQRL